MTLKGQLAKEAKGIFHLHLDYNKVKDAIGEYHNRVKCTFEESTWYSSLIKTDSEKAYVIITDQISAIQKSESDSEIEVKIEADHRVYKCSVPEELIKEMGENPEASDRFHRQSESLQRSIIYKVKNILEPSERRRKARMALMSFL